MIIQGLSNGAAAFMAAKTAAVQRQTFPPASANYADQVSISDAARAMMARSQASAPEREVEQRLDAIKAKPAVARTAADMDYLFANDKRFAEIRDKIQADGFESLTSAEVDYMQKATGFVNTMAELSPKERALYDELVAQGNWQAAQGLNLVAMSRIGMKGQQVVLPNGRSFYPADTEITADNIRNLFRHMFVDDSGLVDRQFEALASYLEQRQTAGAAANEA